nr:ScyD/ScyE family protein [Cellulosimicrobium arenosum]
MPPAESTITTGLVTPLSLAEGPRGTTLVSQNFAGLLTSVAPDGTPTVLYASEDGAEVGAVSYDHGVVTFAETGATQTVKQLRLDRDGMPQGEPRTIADVGAFEERRNPDAKVTYGFRDIRRSCLDQLPEELRPQYQGIVESHPYATTSAVGVTFVADAAANSILSVDWRGTVRTVAVLPAQPVRITAEIAAGQGLPECVVGKDYWFEPVPTDVEIGPWGQLYVTTLPGGPEDDSLGARGAVHTVSPFTGKVRTVATGLLSPTGLAVDVRGTVYVAELFGGQVSTPARKGPQAVVTVPLPGDVEITSKGLLATTNVLPPDETSPPDGHLVRYTLDRSRH